MKHDGIKFNTKSNIPAIYIVYYIKEKREIGEQSSILEKRKIGE